MSYCPQTDGNLAALDAHLSRMDDAEAKHAHAEEMARNELYTNATKFYEATYDLADTLSYSQLTDKQLTGPSYGANPQAKRAMAKRAVLALQQIASDHYYSNAQTESEKALGEFLNAEATYWIEQRADELMTDETADRADYERDRRRDDDMERAA